MNTVLLVSTTTLVGLTAGIFFCWSCSVTVGLAFLPDREYITTFQTFNRAIQNPLFFLCFLGSAVLLPFCTWQQYAQPVPLRFWLLLAASVLYLLGVMVVTIVGNIPMNESLEAFDASTATAAELAARRTAYEKPWNLLNHIRTGANTSSLILAILACLHTPNHS